MTRICGALRGGAVMPDREKVINGLQAHADGCGYRSHHCDAMECPYRYGDESCDIEEMCRDALALMKEQEPIKPVKTYSIPMYVQMNYECGDCRAPMFNEQPYCMKCGKKVKWE